MSEKRLPKKWPNFSNFRLKNPTGTGILDLLFKGKGYWKPSYSNKNLLFVSHRVSEGVSTVDTHYELTSALINSLRGSDIDASIYYLARLIQGGEEPAFLARRMVIFASEDIGNANPNALNLATNVMLAVSKIGYPEARIILAQCAVYLASSPKSNSSYKAINDAIEFVENRPALPVPKYLINTDKAKSEYLYPHDFGGWVEQKYMSTQVKFYKSNAIGFEKTLDEWITKLKESYNEKI